MSNQPRLKVNHDALVHQQEEFTKSGLLLKNIFGISAQHPLLSLVFAVSFGIFTNASYDLTAYLAAGDIVARELSQHTLLVALFGLIPVWVVVRVRAAHKGLFVDVPLEQKKVLVTLVSKHRATFEDTPSYNTYESLLYADDGQAAINALEKVVLVVTESQDVIETADAFKSYIEAAGRDAEIYGLSINDKSQREIQLQMEMMISKIKKVYKSEDIIADYTGGTKDMSVALLKASEKQFIVPVYLNKATEENYSMYR